MAQLPEKMAEMLAHFGSVAIDGLFLCFWAASNVGVSYVLKKLHPEGQEAAIITGALQFLFAIATLAPIAIFIYRDIRVVWIRASRTISDVQS